MTALESIVVHLFVESSILIGQIVGKADAIYVLEVFTEIGFPCFGNRVLDHYPFEFEEDRVVPDGTEADGGDMSSRRECSVRVALQVQHENLVVAVLRRCPTKPGKLITTPNGYVDRARVGVFSLPLNDPFESKVVLVVVPSFIGVDRSGIDFANSDGRGVDGYKLLLYFDFSAFPG
ncbi:hypothetical protein D9M68_701600 [compost metagenome]